MAQQHDNSRLTGFGYFSDLSSEEWLAGMGMTDDDDIGNPGDPLRAAVAGQDHHDAYHTQGMKDAAGCLLCFDYDERHGQYDPETGQDTKDNADGCRDCGMAFAFFSNTQWHQSDCPQVEIIGPASAYVAYDREARQALKEDTGPAPKSPDTPSDGVQVGDRFVHLVPAAYELQCSCGHQRENVQLSDFQTGPGGVYLWDCPSCGYCIEFDGADVHIG
jgi:hypothetical protein